MATVTDTSTDVASRQLERLASMTIAERGELLAALCDDVVELALAGIRQQHPDASPEHLRHLLLVRRYGHSFAESLPAVR